MSTRPDRCAVTACRDNYDAMLVFDDLAVVAPVCVEHGTRLGTWDGDVGLYVLDLDRAAGWRLLVPLGAPRARLYPPGVPTPEI